ncbi:protein kinase C-binding protein NELL1-like isoform X2 [Dysidea avara]
MKLYYLLTLLTLIVISAAQKCKVHPHEINLLKSLLQETEYLDNVDLTDGTGSKKSPAIELDGTHGINVDNTSLIFLEKLHQYTCQRKEILFHASVKFDGMADGPILFIHTRNEVVAFSLEVDSNNEIIKISFIHQGVTIAVSFNYTFSDLSVWHNIIVSFNGRLVTVHVDCEKVGEQIIAQPDYCLPYGVKLNIGSDVQHTKFFKGFLQDLVISFREKGIQRFCHNAYTECQYTASYQALNNSLNELMTVNYQLKNESEELKRNFSMMRETTKRYSCFIDGKQYDYEEFFKSQNGELCFCSTGGTPRCTNPENLVRPTPPPEDKQMCAVNGDKILADHLYFTRISNHSCKSQRCDSNLILNLFVNTMRDAQIHTCEDYLRNCSNATGWSEKQKLASQCCGFCNACQLQSDCPEHSECIDQHNNYTCKCKVGFLQDGNTCRDIDECRNGVIDKYGHYCPRQARCINTPGGFTCQCPNGYQFIDQGGFHSECSDIDECKDHSVCPVELTCKNNDGSFECTCDDGFVRAGDHCIPHCDPPCHSLGKCVANNTCMCPGGLTGKYCESDINECDSNHGCSEHATCINFHGGYFCLCKNGYHGNGKTCTADLNSASISEEQDQSVGSGHS